MAKETLPEKQARLKESCVLFAESLYIYELIARAVGITDDTLKKYRDEDSDFSEQLERQRALFIQRNMRKAKPEFILERAAHQYFKQRTESDLYVKELPKPILQLPEKKDDVDKSS